LPVIVAAEICGGTAEPTDEQALAGRIRLQQVPNKSATVVEKSAKDCIALGAAIRDDDGGEFETLGTYGYSISLSRCTATAPAWRLGCACSVRLLARQQSRRPCAQRRPPGQQQSVGMSQSFPKSCSWQVHRRRSLPLSFGAATSARYP